MKSMSNYSFLAEESAILLYAGVLGLELGLVYDIFRIFRRVWKCNFFVTACMDLFFWGFTAGRTFGVMHTYSNGTLRWFAVLGVLVVLVVYMKWFSKYIVGIGVFVLSRLRTILLKVNKHLTKFLKLSIIKLGKILRKGDRHGKRSSISDEIS